MKSAAIQEPPLSATVPTVADDERYEVIHGKRVRLPPMAMLSIWIAPLLEQYLGSFARTNHLGWALAEALFHLPAPINRDRRPDVAFVSYQRWAKNRALPRG